MSAFSTWANSRRPADAQSAVTAQVTITRKSDAAQAVLYLADSAPRAGTWDNLHNWLPCILTAPTVEWKAQQALTGKSLAAMGDMVIGVDSRARVPSSAGVLTWDEVQSNWSFTGGLVQVHFGGPSLAWADWGLVIRGTAGKAQWDDAKLRLPVHSHARRLSSTSVPPGTYEGSEPDSTQGRVMPLCLGRCLNISPLLISESPWIYQFHDPAYGPVQAIDAVYVNGAAASPSSTSLTAGTITFAADPQGAVTADVRGWVRGGSYLERIGSIMRGLLLEFGQGAAVDDAAFSALDSALPYAVGAYLTQSKDLQQVLDGLCTGLPVYWADGRDGTYTTGLLQPPTGAAALSLQDGTAGPQPMGSAWAWDFAVKHEERWARKIIMKAARNWTVQAAAADSLSASRRAWLAEKWREVQITTGGADPGNVESEEVEFETCLHSAGDAQAVGALWMAMLGSERRLVSCDSRFAPLALSIGDVAEIKRGCWGMAGGFKGLVVKISTTLPGRGSVTVWG